MTEPRGILKALWGPKAGQKRVIECGGALRVGRHVPSDWLFEHDEQMSAEHFEIRWDGQSAELGDLGSIRGTEVQGAKQAEARLRSGQWIRAGGSDFRFFVEGRTPRRFEAPPVTAHAKAALARLSEARVGGELFALVDASRGDRVVELLESCVDVGRSLYEGTQGVALETSSPFLIRFDETSSLLEKLVLEGWHSGWATYFTSDESERELRRHFRRFLFVEAEGLEGRVYFRFYDPRVLMPFLEMATPRQLRELTWPLARIFVPAREGALLELRGSPREDEVDDD